MKKVILVVSIISIGLTGTSCKKRNECKDLKYKYDQAIYNRDQERTLEIDENDEYYYSFNSSYFSYDEEAQMYGDLYLKRCE